MKHITPQSHPRAASLNVVLFQWCMNAADGNCYSLEFQEGVFGFRISVGFIGENVFAPLFSKG